MRGCGRASPRTWRRSCSRSPRSCRSRTACCAGQRKPAAHADRSARATGFAPAALWQGRRRKGRQAPSVSAAHPWRVPSFAAQIL